MNSHSRGNKFVGYLMLPFGLLALCFSTLPLQAGTVTLSGTEWTLSAGLVSTDTDNGTEIWRVRLEGDTANYTETGTFISNVAIKLSDSIIGDNLVLTSAPEGTTLGDWTYLSGGLSGKGCSGNGKGWGCFDFTENELVFGADVGGVVAWGFEVSIDEGTLFNVGEFKAYYVNSDGSKNGLGGDYIGVPEPSTLILLLSSMGLFIGAAGFRKRI